MVKAEQRLGEVIRSGVDISDILCDVNIIKAEAAKIFMDEAAAKFLVYRQK
ncbi:hypothetical protein NDU88_006094, partial [Pleurodeles waltl]